MSQNQYQIGYHWDTNSYLPSINHLTLCQEGRANHCLLLLKKTREIYDLMSSLCPNIYQMLYLRHLQMAIEEYKDWVSLSGFKCWMYGTGENKSAINRRGKNGNRNKL